MMKLTIGMTCYNDYDGFYMTFGALRKYQNMRNCEVIIVDNNPDSADGNEIKKFIERASVDGKVKGATGYFPCKYVPFRDSVGPAQSKDMIFKEASGEYVLVMDSHVLLEEGAIEQLKKYYSKIKNTKRSNCLFTGPLLYDNWAVSTHFFPAWRGYMLGIWANAWERNGEYVNPIEKNGMMKVYDLMSQEEIETDEDIDWVGHENYMLKNGWVQADKQDKPFEIPAQGCGLFSCKKDAWLGFNPDFREFGGEECYIHEKFRQAGRTTYCLPFLKWEHRFYKSHGVEYPISYLTRFRNYVIGHNELGLPLDDLVNHFSSALSKEEINKVLADPKHYEKTEPQPPLPSVKLDFPDRKSLVESTLKTPSALSGYGKSLINIASKYKHVTEISSKKESSIFLLGGNPDLLVSYQSDTSDILKQQEVLLSKEPIQKKVSWSLNIIDKYDSPDIDMTDVLFLDTIETEKQGDEFLDKYRNKVTSWIVIHNTTSFGRKGKDNGPGILYSIDKFIKTYREWFVFQHNGSRYGFTILSKIQEERPEKTINLLKEPCGPGTELKNLLSKIGIDVSPSCNCKTKAKEMDVNGPDWCEQNISTIVQWLKDEYIKQKPKKKIFGIAFPVPFIEFFVIRLVGRAINLARKKDCQ